MLLDNASTSNFVTLSYANKLNLSRRKTNVQIAGLGQNPVGCARSIANVTFCAQFDKTQLFHMEAFVVNKISSNLPIDKVQQGKWPHLNNLTLADPEFHIPADVDILLGAELYYEIVEGTKKIGPINNPIAIKSALGWLIGGGKSDASLPSIAVHHNQLRLNETVPQVEPQLDDLLKRFWEVESCPTLNSKSKEEQCCEEHFLKTYKRDKEGRFIVKFPFKTPRIQLGESLPIAIRRFKQVERRLQKNEKFNKEYVKFMKDYESMGHMIEASPPSEHSKFRCYIPHHFVLKESSTSTKFRVVFDGSCKTSNGKSLNDTMIAGPQIQDSLATLIMRFRKNKIAINGDIQAMYRQILMCEDDQEYQYIVYRETPDTPLKHYKLLTVTYGMTSSPYLATKVLQTLAELEHTRFPLASKVLRDDFYMDDLMSGDKAEEEAIILQQQLIALLKTAQMSIRKFTSNSEKVLQSIDEELRETKSLLSLDKDGGIKALGIYWNPAADVFGFNTENVYEKSTATMTKRVILSEISKLFDPIGWLAPVIIKAKIMMQLLWKEALDWDDIVPHRVRNKWEKLKMELLELQQLKIPRHHQYVSSDIVAVYMVGFSDASQQAYSACVYLCTYKRDGTGSANLVASKTRVAPAQVQSLPRLELCGALLLSEFIPTVIDALKIKLTDVYGFTDSTLVLRWIRSEPYKYKTFVGNRITKIQEKLGSEKWGFVRGIDNPADCASRGISVAELIHHPLWWNGPKWLQEGPPQPTVPEDWTTVTVEPNEELKQITILHTVVKKTRWDIFARYSSLYKLQRVTAYMLRFVYNLRISLQRKRGFTPTFGPEVNALSTRELDLALMTLITEAQNQEFAQELESLRRNESLPKNSKLLTLNPFIDINNVLRVGGRLQNAEIPMNQRHPMLLPQHHKLTTLIVHNAHIINLHAGNQGMMSYLQKKFWIIRMKDTIRRIVSSCVTCRKLKAETMTQIMANLPSFRVNPSPPFQHCGIDYCGPFLIKPISPRSKITLKAYIAVFICCATRAIHLEVVSAASTAAFMAALRRFIGRRGKPTNMYSDNGTNFVGANKEIMELVELTKSESHNRDVSDELAKVGVCWKFNVPSAPSHGGLWEAAVKSTKYHLKRIAGVTRLTFEELSTLTVQIEAILNSRPLSPESNDPNDLRALTPGHFLIGQALTTIPDPDLTSTATNRLVRWQLIQLMTQQFWKRYNAEYISRLQQRPKWMKTEPEITLGAMVIVKEDNLPPLQWKLARVIKLHPALDGHVRSVTVKTALGEYKRPIVKLCLLPVETAGFSTSNNLHAPTDMPVAVSL